MNWTTYSIVLRESFEALLILGLLYSVARRTGLRTAKWSVGLGVVIGIFISLALGYALLSVSEWAAKGVLIFLEIAFPALAALMIFYTVWWMHKFSKLYSKSLKSKAQALLEEDQMWSLALLSCIAVGREGAETVLFLSGDLMGNGLTFSFANSLLLALVSAAGIYFLVTRFFQTLGFQIFFKISSGILILLGFQFLYDAYTQMSSRGWF